MKFRTEKSSQVSMVIQHLSARAWMGICLLTPRPPPSCPAGMQTTHWPRRPSAVVQEEAMCCGLLQQRFQQGSSWLFPECVLPTQRGLMARKDQTSCLRGVFCQKCLPLFEYGNRSFGFCQWLNPRACHLVKLPYIHF